MEEITKWKHFTTVPAFAVTNIGESYSKSLLPSLWKYLAQKNTHILCNGSESQNTHMLEHVSLLLILWVTKNLANTKRPF